MTSPTARRPSRGAAYVYAAGDYAAGAVMSVATAALVHAVVSPGLDMVVAMGIGAAAGTAVHLIAMAIFGTALGMFQVMVPGSVIGMYGGMLFGMRDSMQAASWDRVVAVSLAFGLVVVAGVRLYDRALRTPGGPSRGAP